MNRKLTPEQKEAIKKSVCAAIDDDNSSFFFAAQIPTSENKCKGMAFINGDQEKIVRALAGTAADDPVIRSSILNFMADIQTTIALTTAIIKEMITINMNKQNQN